MNEQRIVPEEVDRPVSSSRLRRLIERLSIMYALTLGGAALGLIAFALLADEVLEQSFVDFNNDVLLWFHSHSAPFWDTAALAVTWLGSGWGVILIGVLFGGYLLLRRHVIDTWMFLLALVGGGVLSSVLKIIFQQTRPNLFTPLAVHENFSFPSGHSSISFCLWGFIATWLVIQNHREIWRWLIGALLLIVAALVAISRLYIGVHWPTDIVAGMFLGAFWVSVCFAGRYWLVERLERKRSSNSEF